MSTAWQFAESNRYRSDALQAAHLRVEHGYSWKRVGWIFCHPVRTTSAWRHLVERYADAMAADPDA